jgi:glycosyltransferase involved in cell wall biosynthesis
MRDQDYPRDKVEIVVSDSYSTDGTIEAAQSFGARIVYVPKTGSPEGKDGPKSIGCREATGEIIFTIDSDNKLVGKDWITKMVYPLVNDPEVTYVICRMHVAREDVLINQYCSLIGTDPFAAYCSADPQIRMGKLQLEDRGRYGIFRNTPDRFLVCGGYYVAYRKSTLGEMGGYARDVDTMFELAKRNGGAVIAVPHDTYIHHWITTGWGDFYRKKIRWSYFYFTHPEPDRPYQWTGVSRRARFYWQVIRSLILLPAMFETAVMLSRDGQRAWWLHAPVTWLTTFAYLVGYAKARLSPPKK